jgi:hypothetical protein
MIRPKKGNIVWASVNDNLSRKVQVTSKRKVKGQTEYRVFYLMANGGAKWITADKFIKYA